MRAKCVFMKMEFDEPQRRYDSGSQNARVLTESWIADRLYCLNCGNPKISQLPPNSPVADFFCALCREEYELKSQKTPFKGKILDGAFRTMCERLAADNNPNLLL